MDWTGCPAVNGIEPRNLVTLGSCPRYNRVNEAIAAWAKLADDRLIILVRSVLGALWRDDEVLTSLQTIPRWWERDQTDEPEHAGYNKPSQRSRVP